MTFTCRVLCLLLTLAAVTMPGRGQSTAAEITARLSNKPLYIRGFWSDDSLKFDSNGDLIAPSQRSPFTVDGFFLRSLELKNGVLKLTGAPMGTEFLKDGPKCVLLPGHKRTITITAPPDGNFGPALDTIFADGLEALAPAMPGYWQGWARRTYPGAFPAGVTTDAGKAADQGLAGSRSDATQPSKAGGSFSAPRILKPSYPVFNQEAKDLRYSGTTLVHLVVETDGRPSHVDVERPLGLGLDEMALTSVQQYLFAPATRSDRPVRTEVVMEVNFQIF